MNNPKKLQKKSWYFFSKKINNSWNIFTIFWKMIFPGKFGITDLKKLQKYFFLVKKNIPGIFKYWPKKNKIFFFTKKNKVGIKYSKKIPKCVLRITYTILQIYFKYKLDQLDIKKYSSIISQINKDYSTDYSHITLQNYAYLTLKKQEICRLCVFYCEELANSGFTLKN